MKELPVPPQAIADPQAVEMLRVWAAQGQQCVSLVGTTFDDPAIWGIFLADLVRHIARAYHLTDGADLNQTVERLKAGFQAEMDNVTDWGEGSIQR